MSDIAKHRRGAARTQGAYCLPGPEMVVLLDEIERLRAERDEWKAKWIALAQAAMIVGALEEK
jgi:hypothetical protein